MQTYERSIWTDGPIVIYTKNYKRRQIKTVNGNMSYIKWLQQECDRINSIPGRKCTVMTAKIKNGAGNMVDQCWLEGNGYIVARS